MSADRGLRAGRPCLGTSTPGYTLNVAGRINASGKVKEAGFDVMPAGAMMQYLGSSAPGGWLVADGSAVSRITYAALFAPIGITYGAGNGSTTFNLPDLRGRVAVGAGQGSGLTNRTLAASGGEEQHTLTVADLAAQSHGVTDPGHRHALPYKDNGAIGSLRSFLDASSTGANDDGHMSAATPTGISIQNTGSGTAHNVMQPYLVVSYIIKY